ncbi:MAG: regulatory protein RecX [Gammaproteobacteria bacterium]|nr:regulatory protein RecX [Gammaproteobacteria bacterium]
MSDLIAIKSKAIDYLVRREHSRHELKQKLAIKFPDSDALIDQVIQELADKCLQSDERFLDVFIRHRANQGYGLVRIKQEMSQHHIDSDLFNRIVDDLAIDWFEMAKNLYEKRYGNKPIADFKDKMKRSQYLYSHGFSQDQIKAIF